MPKFKYINTELQHILNGVHYEHNGYPIVLEDENNLYFSIHSPIYTRPTAHPTLQKGYIYNIRLPIHPPIPNWEKALISICERLQLASRSRRPNDMIKAFTMPFLPELNAVPTDKKWIQLLKKTEWSPNEETIEWMKENGYDPAYPPIHIVAGEYRAKYKTDAFLPMKYHIVHWNELLQPTIWKHNQPISCPYLYTPPSFYDPACVITAKLLENFPIEIFGKNTVLLSPKLCHKRWTNSFHLKTQGGSTINVYRSDRRLKIGQGNDEIVGQLSSKTQYEILYTLLTNLGSKGKGMVSYLLKTFREKLSASVTVSRSIVFCDEQKG